MTFFLTVLGVVLILEGIPWFLSPTGMQTMLREMARLPENRLRVLGLISMIVGLFLVFVGVN